MNAHDFTIWLQGFLDAVGDMPSAAQTRYIKQRLADVLAPKAALPTPIETPPLYPPGVRITRGFGELSPLEPTL